MNRYIWTILESQLEGDSWTLDSTPFGIDHICIHKLIQQFANLPGFSKKGNVGLRHNYSLMSLEIYNRCRLREIWFLYINRKIIFKYYFLFKNRHLKKLSQYMIRLRLKNWKIIYVFLSRTKKSLFFVYLSLIFLV